MDNKAWHVEDVFTSEILCNSSIGSTSKITPLNFMCNRHKLTERNCKKFCAKFSELLGGKLECSPSDNESGKTCEDYFVSAINNTFSDVPDKDDCKGHPLISGSMAFYLFSPFSPFPNDRLACFSMNALNDIDKKSNNRNAARLQLKLDKDDTRKNDPCDRRGLSQEEHVKKQKLDIQNKTLIVLNNKVITGRRNTYMATLASRIDTAMANVKNC